MKMDLKHIVMVFDFSKKSPIARRIPKTKLFFKIWIKIYPVLGVWWGGALSCKSKKFDQ